jgi:2-dehydropantoate 2-reductase
MKILVFGAGVIGSVYGGALARSGHSVTMLARGHRLTDLRSHGLVLEEAESGRREVLAVGVVDVVPPDAPYDLVLVAVRADQLSAALPALSRLPGDVLFFGNTAGRSQALVDALGPQAFFGFPAAGGVRDGCAVRYALVGQQRTMLGEVSAPSSRRVEAVRAAFEAAGFRTTVSSDIEGWLLGHAAFVGPVGLALLGAGSDPGRLAADPSAVRTMVRATRQAFRALGAAGQVQVPRNLAVLYRLPTPFVVSYWRRVFRGPRGELWFAAHTRSAPEEMRALAEEVQAAVRRTGHSAPDLDALLEATEPQAG